MNRNSKCSDVDENKRTYVQAPFLIPSMVAASPGSCSSTTALVAILLFLRILFARNTHSTTTKERGGVALSLGGGVQQFADRHISYRHH